MEKEIEITDCQGNVLEIGDKVICIDAEGLNVSTELFVKLSQEPNEIFTINRIDKYTESIRVIGMTFYYARRFFLHEKASTKPREELLSEITLPF